MNTFTIGQTEHGKLKLDLSRLVDTRAAIMASSGGGKSWLFRLIAERVAAKVQTILIDPEGEFATLREKLDIILVGEGGELAADVRTAKLLARKLAELRVSAVIDLYDVTDSWDGRRAYLAEFIDGLMNIPKSLYATRLVLIDEAHQFAPEAVGASKDSPAHRSRRAVSFLMSAGRKRGLGTILATQRISKLDKDALAECKNIFIGQTTLDIDQQRCADVMGIPGKERTLLRDLDPGEFFAFGPALEHKGVSRFHSDQVQTTHPKAGQRLTDVPKPSESVRAMVSELGDLPAEVKRDADALTQAQREVIDLKRQLTTRPVQSVPKIEKVIERVEVPVLNGEAKRLESAVGQMLEISTNISGVSTAIQGAATDIAQALRVFNNRPTPAPTRAPVSAPVKTRVPVAPRVVVEADGVPLQKAERKILTVLAQYPHGRTKTQVAILAGYAVKGGGFNNAVGGLNSKGYLKRFLPDTLNITDSGLDALGSYEPLPTGRELVDYWLRELDKAARSILAVATEVYPTSITKEELAERAGYEVSGGGFNNALGKLRTLELISGRGEIKASDDLFTE